MRAAGILLPISSLPGKYGIGTLGEEAFAFVDFLSDAKQTYWQILPLGPTTYGDSPYQTYSTFAGSGLYLDLEHLYSEKLITKKDLEFQQTTIDFVNYDNLKVSRMNLYKKASIKFFKNPPQKYEEFLEKENEWVIGYAKFRALKTYFNEKSFNEWPDEVIKGNISEEIANNIKDDVNLHLFIQYMFYTNYERLKNYAHQKGVQIIGDLPIYVAYDSSDVWQNPEEFQLDENLKPTMVAGCPPDSFCEDGQLWGNPLYNYQEMKKNNYKWWMRRLNLCLKMFDVLRIDHFRGFEAYFAIPATDKTAKNGHWEKGPNFDIFAELFKEHKHLKMIMEDLGYLTPEVHRLLNRTGFPGMRVLEFAFDGRKDNNYLPHNYVENTVVYTGTHDNLPLVGWVKTLSVDQIDQIITYFNLDDEDEIPSALVEAALSSIASTAIIPLQDYLGLDESSRINTPSTVGCNWKWRVNKELLTFEIIEKIKKLTEKYFR